MNERIGTSQIKNATPAWDRPVAPPALSANRTEQDIALWWELIDRVMATAGANGYSKTEVAKRMGMPEGTFSQWFSGKYAGRLDSTNRTVEQWLLAVEEQAGLAATIPTSPGFIKTRIATEITETLAWAQMTADMVMVTLAAGNGKTATSRHYCSTRPHAYLVTISPHTKTVHGMLLELAAVLEVHEHNPAKLTRKIGEKLGRIGGGSLLIIDEAQNLADEAINQLRHFVDVYQCGVALVGNNEVYTRFVKKSDGPSYDQLKSRLGKRLKRDKPRLEDLQAFIAAWGVVDPDCVKLLTGIGMKGGALRQIDKTLKLASLVAMGAQEPLAKKHIEAAWKNRDVEDMA
ncbi:AAA family ATPase [Rhizobium sp. S163]|uniref:AAA family ATPase n=1 Tax=Rhizobium sp. S163 TaxID=3055039 RepID=UPI0025A9648F|nr:AAA family ATPase [Rhizobium sp. S163]MDM9647719.1 AAA family ATPase [Rhizobium sp. S163]